MNCFIITIMVVISIIAITCITFLIVFNLKAEQQNEEQEILQEDGGKANQM